MIVVKKSTSASLRLLLLLLHFFCECSFYKVFLRFEFYLHLLIPIVIV